MFDTSSFRIRYKAPVEKPLLIGAGPLAVAAVLVAALWSRFVYPISIGPWISSDLLGLLLPIAGCAALALLIERLFGLDQGYPWRRSMAATGAGIVGGTLLVGAWGKVLDPLAFADTMRQEGLVGWLDGVGLPTLVPPLLVVALEILLGSLLVLGVRYRAVLTSTALLSAFFLFLTGRSWWREAHGLLADDASCGCFGNLLDRTPQQAFWQDALLLVPGLALAALAVIQRRTLGRRVALAFLLTAAATAFGWFAPRLPIDDLATRLGRGTAISGICAGSGAERLCLPTLQPELEHGRQLVVLLDLRTDGLEDAVERLSQYWNSGGEPRLWVLAAGTAEESRAFFWKYGPSFETREAPPPMLRPLYRTLPRSFVVEDGIVTDTWSGLPPLETWTGAASSPSPGGDDSGGDTP